MTKGERWFTGWMDPRGIVAASTATTFSAGLVSHDIQGAPKILPVTFLVIVVTVAVYGLTAVPVARRLGVTRPARARPLLVGGEDWVVDLGRTLRSLGLDILMWAGSDEQRQRIMDTGLELAPGELLASATGQGAQLLADADGSLLFAVRADGRLAPATPDGPPEPQAGDTLVLLGPVADRS
jgi:hypothetical protein